MKCWGRITQTEIDFFIYSITKDEWMDYVPNARLLEDGGLLYGNKIIKNGDIVVVADDKSIVVFKDRAFFNELFNSDWASEQEAIINESISEQNDKFIQRHFPIKVSNSEYQNELAKLQNKLMDVLSEINILINKNK